MLKSQQLTIGASTPMNTKPSNIKETPPIVDESDDTDEDLEVSHHIKKKKRKRGKR